MNPVEESIVRRLDQGASSVSLAEIGGEAAVLAQASDLARSPLFSEVACALVASHAKAENPQAIEALLLNGLRRLDDEIAFRGTVNAIITAADIVGRIKTELADVLIDRARARKTPPDIRVEATEAAFRIALPLADPPFDLMGLFERLRPGEDPRVLRRLPALIGLAFDHWHHDRLIGFLEALTADSQCAAEAHFELGMARLGSALAETEVAAAIIGIRAAKTDFAAAVASCNDAIEALAYDAVLSLLLAFIEEKPAADLRDYFARLEDAVLTKEVWLHGTRPRKWLRRRQDIQLQWVMLGQSLIEATERLGQPSWWHIIDALHGIFAVYVASRSYDVGRGPGLEGLLQPRIQAAFLRQAGLLKHLDDYLAEADDDLFWSDVGADLRRQIDIIARTGSAPPPGKPPGDLPSRIEDLLPQINVGQLSPAQLGEVDRILAEAEASTDAFTWTQDRIFSDLCDKLSASPDYSGRVKESFSQLIALTLRFLTNRLDIGRQSASKRADYLFEWEPDGKVPVEADLQWDFHDFLVGSFLQHRMSVEKRDVASGRVDVEIKFDGFRFITEIKREMNDPSPEAMTAYLAQAADYQVTDVKLGLLLVLDLSTYAVPMPGVERCVWVSEVPIGTSEEVRHVVVVRLLGRRKRPSDQTAIQPARGLKPTRRKKKAK